MDDEYAKLIRRMNPPRVVIHNDTCKNATVIQVDSVNKHGILLEVVQVLTDLNLVITKAYISSDGGWFMDVFNVVDQDGNKIRDEGVIDYIQKTLENDSFFFPSLRGSVGVMPSEDHTSIELAGTDRPGLLSEVCAVLAGLGCNVVNAEIWTHNSRAALVVHVTDDSTGCSIKDPNRLSTIKELLRNVLKGDNDLKTAKMALSPPGVMHRERRLHQMMFDDRDYERNERAEHGRVVDNSLRPNVSVIDCFEKDYTVITMRSKDRPKLLFDTVCTLTDMQYVVFHGVVHTGRMEAFQEYYIRHVDGVPISSEAERERVIQCLEAAIERRASEGLELELCTEDRVGLLSGIMKDQPMPEVLQGLLHPASVSPLSTTKTGCHTITEATNNDEIVNAFVKDFETRTSATGYSNEDTKLAEEKFFASDFEPMPNLSVYHEDAGLKGKKTFVNDFEPRRSITH